MKYIFSSIAFLVSLATLTSATQGQSNFEKEIRLYEEGKYAEAAQSLKGKAKDDVEAAYYLGMSYERLGQAKEAVKAYDKSVSTLIQKAAMKISERSMLAKNPQFDLMNVARAEMKDEIDFGYRSLMRWKEVDPAAANTEKWQDDNGVIESFRMKPVDAENLTLFQIKKQRPWEISAEARQSSLEWRARVVIFFLASGKVGPVIPMQYLPHGLNKSAVDAAREIKFVPAMTGGQPITTAKAVEYFYKVD
jgi:tetratricopeptide (TPR) repeat protein